MIAIVGIPVAVITAQSSFASTTYYVTTSGSDSNPCTSISPCASLQAALAIATTGSTIQLGNGVFTNTTSSANEVSLAQLTINGSGSALTTIDADSSSDFVVQVDPSATATISNLTVGVGALNGQGVTNLTNDAISNATGAENLQGTLNVTNDAISGYLTNDTGSMTISGSTFTGGGDVQQNGTGGTVVTNSTFQGGSIEGFSGTTTLKNVTMSTTTHPSSIVLDNGGGTVSVQGSIIAGDCSGAMTDLGYNLDFNDSPTNSCAFSTLSHDVVESDPLLGTLANNGGSQETLAIPANSPALNIVPLNLCPATDAVGTVRPQPSSASACDIGAFELPVATPVSPSPAASTTTTVVPVVVPTSSTTTTTIPIQVPTTTAPVRFVSPPVIHAVVGIASKTVQLAGKPPKAVVSLTCRTLGCSGRISITKVLTAKKTKVVKQHGKTVRITVLVHETMVIASGSYRLAANHREKFPLALTASGKSMVKNTKVLRATLRVTTSNGSATTAAVSLTV